MFWSRIYEGGRVVMKYYHLERCFCRQSHGCGIVHNMFGFRLGLRFAKWIALRIRSGRVCARAHRGTKRHGRRVCTRSKVLRLWRRIWTMTMYDTPDECGWAGRHSRCTPRRLGLWISLKHPRQLANMDCDSRDSQLSSKYHLSDLFWRAKVFHPVGDEAILTGMVFILTDITSNSEEVDSKNASCSRIDQKLICSCELSVRMSQQWSCDRATLWRRPFVSM